MIIQGTQYPIYDTERYKRIQEIHQKIDAEKSKDEPDNDVLIKEYLKEMEQAMLMGPVLGKNYGTGRFF